MANPQPDKFTKFSNELLEAYIKRARLLSPYENAVWLCIFRKTYGFNKKEDWISLSQIEEMTEIRQPHVARTKKKLLLKNMVIKQNGGIGINKNYDQWGIPKQVYPNRYNIPKQVLPKQVSELTQTGNPNLPKQVIKDLPKQVDTKEIITKETITKETYTKDISETIVSRDYFYSNYKKVFKRDYIADFGKDGRIFKDLLKMLPITELQGLIDKFFASQDKFIKDSGYTVGIFKNKINKLRGEHGADQGSNRSSSEYAGLETEIIVDSNN